MLRLLMILAVVVAVTYAPMPATGQASDDNRAERQPNHHETAASHAPANPISSVAPKPIASSHPQPETGEKSSANAQDSVTIIESTSMPGKRDWVDYASLFIGVVIAFITGFGVVAAWRGLPELRRQAEGAREAANVTREAISSSTDTAKKQLRAYLCVSEACLKITEHQIIQDRSCTLMEGQISIKNVGQTPAYDVRAWVHGSLRVYPEYTPVPPPPDGLPRGVAIIPPNAPPHVVVAKETAEFPNIMQDLRASNIAYYVQGEVHYRDIFKDWRCLKVRMFFGGPAGTRTVIDASGKTLGRLVPDSWGNTEDDEADPNSQQHPN